MIPILCSRDYRRLLMATQIVNKRFKLTLDLDRSNDHVIGWSSHGGVNQQVRPTNMSRSTPV